MSFDVKAGFAWVKSHPWEAGGLAFIIAVGAVLLLGKHGSSASSGGPDANLSSYLSAETAQNAQDNAFALGKVQADAATAQAGILANQNIDTNRTWAAADLATTQANNDATAKKSLIDYFGQLANNIGTILTSSSSSQSGSGGGLNLGFNGFGFGFNSNSSNASSSTQQTLAANTQQSAAEHELELIANTQFHSGS